MRYVCQRIDYWEVSCPIFFILVSTCGPTVELITSTHTLQQKLHQLLQVSLLTEVRILNN